MNVRRHLDQANSRTLFASRPALALQRALLSRREHASWQQHLHVYGNHGNHESEEDISHVQ